MTAYPEFPQFKPVELGDRDIIHPRLKSYQPQTSELTFTNLFMWRGHYGFQWSVYQDWLLILADGGSFDKFFFMPIGPSSRKKITRILLDWLSQGGSPFTARIERADQRLITELAGEEALLVEPNREAFDYVYEIANLINLTGNKYHSKKNHINRFIRLYSYSYEVLSENYISACLDLADQWCTLRRCEDDMNLMGEWEALKVALTHFRKLELSGGVILLNGRVMAFTLGEMLNTQTAVVHIEKADSAIPELYAVINREFCAHCWSEVPQINREQDCGEPGLRKAKLSYHPHHLEEKFLIKLKE
ncbi:MAG: DUF2156 domain-containing protein [Deltaproteobacteria bacterium]|nr:DUF2156 domain-containing protein [Deltaproteobacteria bacterium]